MRYVTISKVFFYVLLVEISILIYQKPKYDTMIAQFVRHMIRRLLLKKSYSI